MDGRHHRATPNVIIVLPDAGSPKHARPVKPRYPQHQPREHWTGPPKRKSKAEVLREFMRRTPRMKAARSLMRPDAAGLAAWLNRAA
jgi:hypothetical protein